MNQCVEIPIDARLHEGVLDLPPAPVGIVLFAHGSGSSRLSPRNTYVANMLRKENIATLLFDLLTEEEDVDYRRRFDIDLLTQRLISATRWVRKQEKLKILPMGYFGASTGAAAALKAAAALSDEIRAVVSRGGRPDLAEDALPAVHAATLLIVGGDDLPVIELNKFAYQKLDAIDAIKELKIVPGATHLFEEPGTLEEVARLAAAWFRRYLS